MVDAQLAQLSDTLFWVAMAVYAVAMGAFFAALYRGARIGAAATVIAWGGLLVHATSIATRALSVGRVPWGNMFEYSNMIGLLLVAVYLLVLDRRLGLRQLGGFAMGAAVLALAGARGVYAPAGPLVPALQSWWLRVHVLAAIVASTLFGLSFIFTVLSLVKSRIERRSPAFTGSTVGAAYVGTEPEAPAERREGLPVDFDNEEPALAERRAMSRIPSAARFDTLAFRTIQIAFPVWTFAVIAGAIWAHEAWGRYWGWDPKETFAFVTWVIYAGYLHARATAGWRGTRAAVISVAGFVSVLFTYFAVNLWIAGLHSYQR